MHLKLQLPIKLNQQKAAAEMKTAAVRTRGQTRRSDPRTLDVRRDSQRPIANSPLWSA